MKLKTKFKIISVVVIGLITAIGVFIFSQVRILEAEIEENRIAAEIVRGVFELNLLTSDYSLHSGERTQEQWQLRHQSLGSLIQSNTLTMHFQQRHLEEQAVLDNLSKNHELIQTTFLKLTEDVSPELEERLVAELSVKSQSMLSDASLLMNFSRVGLAAFQQKVPLFIIFSITVLAGIIFFLLFMVTRDVLKPLLNLQKGVEIVGSGDLKYRIEIKRKDEIGELTSGFNDMNAKLRESYSGLEQKVKERTKKVSELNSVLKLLNKILRHDILNDLTVVEGQISMHSDEKGEAQEFTDATTAIGRSKTLVTQMRALESAVSEGAGLKPMKIKEVVDECAQGFPDIKFFIKGDAVVNADEALCSVVENIIDNAKIHGKANSVTFNVNTKGDFVEIGIADDGKGISDDIKNKLFQEGFKYGETGHTGLGLYIVRKTIERYGGSVSVGDNKPKGAVFVLQIPVGKGG